MAARGHFVFPIDAKNHRVLVIWELNGYGEYELDWCTVFVTKLWRQRNQKHNNNNKFLNFGDIIMLQQCKCVDSQKGFYNVLFWITFSAICEYLRSEHTSVADLRGGQGGSGPPHLSWVSTPSPRTLPPRTLFITNVKFRT